MNQARVNASKSALVDLSELPMCFERSSSAQLAGVLENIPLKLPQEGQYHLVMTGKTLHIYEAVQGVSRYSFSDPSAVKAFNMVADGIEVEMARGAVSKIVLHKAPTPIPAQAVTLEELVAPVGLIEEFAALHGKQKPTAADLDRKRQLLKQIGEDFVRRDQLGKTRTKTRTTKPTSSGPDYYSKISVSGESCGGRVAFGG